VKAAEKTIHDETDPFCSSINNMPSHGGVCWHDMFVFLPITMPVSEVLYIYIYMKDQYWHEPKAHATLPHMTSMVKLIMHLPAAIDKNRL